MVRAKYVRARGARASLRVRTVTSCDWMSLVVGTRIWDLLGISGQTQYMHQCTVQPTRATIHPNLGVYKVSGIMGYGEFDCNRCSKRQATSTP